MEYADCKVFSGVALDHATNPRNHGPLKSHDGHARITGPCGDTMEFWMTVVDGHVDKVSFITDGCGSSLACGSMATTLAEGKPIEAAATLRQQDILGALGGLPPELEHCALLAANTIKAACQDYLKNRKAVCDTCGDKSCAASKRNKDESQEAFEDRRKLQSRLCRIRHKIVVLSGKGGVGKSTVAVNLAAALAKAGKRVGLLDIDIHGPSIPTMLGLEGSAVAGPDGEMHPIEVEGIKVVSIGFFLENQDHAVVWRGPMKTGVIKQFLKDVAWGELDYLIVDSPPGTGDEPLSACQLIGSLDGAVIVTTPQRVATVDVRKSITFCRLLEVPVLGVVENMSGFACPKCGQVTQILQTGGGKRIADDLRIPFLGSIPMNPKIAEAGDKGQAFIHHYSSTATSTIVMNIINPIISSCESTKQPNSIDL
ncbi:P-loop NTPase [candidate division TA06 bacterium]|uniref:Iron-sulfur cluster carrier protein n=1 Tax=candidate division TA06 bacterium TaxID=2250710 RepID=A0A933I8F3_UNCT6|nr:P-loop NTPase [candidate division TA06 bacterium]